MRVLAFCADVLPAPGLPTSGGGLRSQQLLDALTDAGHEVVASVPLFTHLARRYANAVPAVWHENAWEPHDQDRLVDRCRPDAILFCSTWITNHLTRRPDAWLLQDLNGPQLLEMHYKRDLDDRAVGEKLRRLAWADFAFCAGLRQRYYFWSLLLLAGWTASELAGLPVVPFTLSGLPPQHDFPKELTFLTGGGFYPWLDARPGLRRVADFFRQRATAPLRLRVLGASHSVTAEDDARFAEIRSLAATDPRITLEGYLPRPEHCEQLRTASLALDLHEPNAERELAIPTRTVDSLWHGLPVVTYRGNELADEIEASGAGWCIPADDPAALTTVLESILTEANSLLERSQAAHSWALRRGDAAATSAPLLRFLANPRRRNGDRCDVPIVTGDEARQLRSLRESRLYRYYARLKRATRRFG